jgi:thiamine-monophosphate kinase
MIDISDGILLDLERITSQQGTGAKLELMKLPTSKQYMECIHQYSDDQYGLALSGGEDYELLFTSHEDRRGDIQKISKNLNIQITEIGHVTKDKTVKIINPNGEAAPITNRGFVHFNN